MLSPCHALTVLADQEIAKQPRAAAIQWFATAEADANEQEVLFYAFLLIWTAKHASDLDFWARRVLHERVETSALLRAASACLMTFAA